MNLIKCGFVFVFFMSNVVLFLHVLCVFFFVVVFSVFYMFLRFSVFLAHLLVIGTTFDFCISSDFLWFVLLCDLLCRHSSKTGFSSKTCFRQSAKGEMGALDARDWAQYNECLCQHLEFMGGFVTNTWSVHPLTPFVFLFSNLSNAFGLPATVPSNSTELYEK